MAALPTRKVQDEDAQPAKFLEKNDVPAERGSAAQGGIVGDWQRRIEERISDPIGRPEESRGDAFLRQVSRAAGYGALAAAYLTIGWLIFG